MVQIKNKHIYCVEHTCRNLTLGPIGTRFLGASLKFGRKKISKTKSKDTKFSAGMTRVHYSLTEKEKKQLRLRFGINFHQKKNKVD